MTQSDQQPQGVPVATDPDVASAVTELVCATHDIPAAISHAAGQAAQHVIDSWMDGADPRLSQLTPANEAEATYVIASAIAQYPHIRADILAHAGLVDQRNKDAVVALSLLADLDRCQHGRHSIDSCLSCPDGQSAGNPYCRPGAIIGFDYAGRVISMPTNPAEQLDPSAWYGEPQTVTP